MLKLLRNRQQTICLKMIHIYILNVASTDPKKIVSNDNNIDSLVIEEFDFDGLTTVMMLLPTFVAT
jgi:hypothetical protein